MSKVTPATIIFTPPSGVEQTIDFHAVEIEDHSTTAQITKYPVQEGIHVTNHSIRKNRVFSVTAMISNMRTVDYEGNVTSGRDYGEGATRKVKEVFDSLIHSGTECRVVTNLGEYNPVVFSSFKTKQKAGMVDSMQLHAVGEEIIKVDTENYTAPTPISFVEVTGPARAALVSDLGKMGIEVDDCDKLSQGEHWTDESFIIDAIDSAGKAVNTVFEFLGNDPVSRAAQYAQHVTGIDVVSSLGLDVEDDPCAEKGFADSLKGGLKQVGGKLLDVADDFIEEQTERHVETAMGKLSKSTRGIFYDTVTMDSSSGQALATAGLGTIIRGITGVDSEFPYIPGESLPSVDEIMSGNLFPTAKKETLTKVECACPPKDTPNIDSNTLPVVG